jgi:hypothetical protein
LKIVAAQRYSHVTLLSYTTWLAGTVAAVEIGDCPRGSLPAAPLSCKTFPATR